MSDRTPKVLHNKQRYTENISLKLSTCLLLLLNILHFTLSKKTNHYFFVHNFVLFGGSSKEGIGRNLHPAPEFIPAPISHTKNLFLGCRLASSMERELNKLIGYFLKGSFFVISDTPSCPCRSRSHPPSSIS